MHSIEVFPGKRVPLLRPVAYVNLLYFAAALLAMMALDNVFSLVAIVGAPLHLVAGRAEIASWACCYLLVPAAIVWFATHASVDGRLPHRWAVSFLRYLVRPKRTTAGQPIRREGARSAYRSKIGVRWDLATPRLHHGWIKGGAISSSVQVKFTHAITHKSPVVRGDDQGSPLFEYEVEERLQVRP